MKNYFSTSKVKTFYVVLENVLQELEWQNLKSNQDYDARNLNATTE